MYNETKKTPQLGVGFIVTKISEFDEDSQKIICRWFTIRSIAESTAQTYLSYISQFTKHSKKKLSDIYLTAQKQQFNQVPLNQRQLTQLILDYKYFIDHHNYAQTTKNIKLNVIYSFCKAFEFETPQIRRKRAICEDKNYERPITKQELMQLLDSNPLREKAFLMIQATSGMSSKETRNLTIHDLIQIINNETQTHYETCQELIQNQERILQQKIFKIQLTRTKVNYRYTTFITKECMEHILNYLNYRLKQTNNKRLTGNLQETVFITNTGKKLSSRAVTAMYREMGNKTGFVAENKTYRFWRSHNIRKYFYNIAEEIVGSEYADEWLGHMPNKVTRAYARREYRMREAYIKCLPYLTLEEDVSEVKQKINDLEEEIRRLKRKYE